METLRKNIVILIMENGTKIYLKKLEKFIELYYENLKKVEP